MSNIVGEELTSKMPPSVPRRPGGEIDPLGDLGKHSLGDGCRGLLQACRGRQVFVQINGTGRLAIDRQDKAATPVDCLDLQPHLGGNQRPVP